MSSLNRYSEKLFHVLAIIKDETLASRKTADWVCFGGKSWKTNSRWPKIVDKRLNMTYERIQKRNLQDNDLGISDDIFTCFCS